MTESDRNLLIEQHLEAVVSLARRFSRKIPSCFDYRDLVGVAVIALIVLAPRYDPARGTFWNYASVRALGAMRDYVRQNWPYEVGRIDLAAIELALFDEKIEDKHRWDGHRSKRLERVLAVPPLQESRLINSEGEKESSVRVRKLVKILPRRERQVMTEASRGLKNREISESLQLSYGAVRVYRHQALRKVRMSLAA